MREESRTPTSHNPGKPECQEKASSGGDSRYVDCCDIAGLLPGRQTEAADWHLGQIICTPQEIRKKPELPKKELRE